MLPSTTVPVEVVVWSAPVTWAEAIPARSVTTAITTKSLVNVPTVLARMMSPVSHSGGWVERFWAQVVVAGSRARSLWGRLDTRQGHDHALVLLGNQPPFRLLK